MRTRRDPFLAAVILFLSAAAAAGGEAEVERIIVLGRSENRVMEHLDFLCNRFGPRLTGSDNLQNASEWARDAFREFGLADARLEKWGEFAVGFNRGPWSGRMTAPMEKTLHFGTNAWTAGTRGVQRGPALLAPLDEAELEKARGKLAGAWVLLRHPGGEQPRGEFRRKLDAAFEEVGIAGTIRPSGGALIQTGGRPTPAWDKLPTIPAVNLLRTEYDEIAALLGKGEAVELEFDIRNWFKKGPVPLFNVIADLPGTERPDELVIAGGHIDSWDGATGAMDNGTGCAAVMEAARLLAKAGARPRRTIRFMLWSGEEQGLLGSRAYVKANPDLMGKISAVLVHDGGTNAIAGIQATEAMRADLEKVFAPAMGLDPELPFQIRQVPGLPPFIGSDHDSFLAAGVPGFYWMQRGRASYNRIHHTQFDTFDGAIPEYQRHSAVVIALAARGIANLDRLLPRENLVAPRSLTRGGGRRMGVQLDELRIVEVMEGTAAERGGLKAGDVILKIDGKALSSREELVGALQAGEPKKTITVLREGAEKDLVLEWPRPAPAGSGR